MVFEPARSAFLPSIVEPPTLLAANALAQTARVSAGMAGAALAGLLLTLPNGPVFVTGPLLQVVHREGLEPSTN